MDDKVLIALLVELASLEEELALAETTLSHHTSRTRDLRELQAEYEEDAAVARRGDQDAATRLRGKENEIRAAEVALASKREQKIGCRDSRQFEALRREISGLEHRISVLEDEAMVLLAATEQAATGRSTAEADRSRQRERGALEVERLAGEAKQAAAARDELVTEIDDRVKLLPEAVRRHVLRLRSNGGQAVVRVSGGACGGCFGQLPAQQGLDAAQGRSLVRCAGCARYVVHRPWR